MRPAPDGTARATGLHEAALRAAGLLSFAAGYYAQRTSAYEVARDQWRCLDCGGEGGSVGSIAHSDACVVFGMKHAAKAIVALIPEESERLSDADIIRAAAAERARVLAYLGAVAEEEARCGDHWWGSTLSPHLQAIRRGEHRLPGALVIDQGMDFDRAEPPCPTCGVSAGLVAEVRAEAAAAERARLTQPEPERVERLARIAYASAWAEIVGCDPSDCPPEEWDQLADEGKAVYRAEVRAILAALAAETPCPTCGATDERECRAVDMLESKDA